MKRLKPLRRTPLKKVSEKRRKEGRIYTDLRREFLEKNPLCQAHKKIVMWAAYKWKHHPLAMETWYGCDPENTPTATEIHHTMKPRCKYLNDTSTWLAVSRWSHNFIEDNKSVARELGLLK